MKLQWSENGTILELETDSAIQLTDARFQDLARRITNLKNDVDYAQILVVEQIESTPECLRYDYAVVHQDGREWCHTLVFDILTDPLVTFEVTGSWRRSEYRAFYDLRNALGEIARHFRLIKLEVTRTG